MWVGRVSGAGARVCYATISYFWGRVTFVGDGSVAAWAARGSLLGSFTTQVGVVGNYTRRTALLPHRVLPA